MLRRSTYAIAFALLCAPAVAAAEDWPQIFGPRRDGASAETGLLSEYGKTKPKQRWRKKLGPGFSGIAVVGDTAYTMFADEKAEYLVALNTKDGAERWRLRTGDRYEESAGGPGPRTTPSVASGKVYAISANCELFAADAKTGKQLWHHDLKKDYGTPVPKFGCSSSPLIDGERLILNIGGKEGYALGAFHKDTGKLLWHSGGGSLTYASPMIFELGKRRLILYMAQLAFVVADAKTGKELHRRPFEHQYKHNSSTPLKVGKDRVLIFHGAGDPSAVLRLEDKPDGSIAVHEVWTSGTIRTHLANAVYADGYIYSFKSSRLVCIDAKTGEEAWNQKGIGRASVLLADGRLIVLSEDGELVLVALNPKAYTELGRKRIFDGRCWTQPSLSNGTLYLRDLEEITALELKAG